MQGKGFIRFFAIVLAVVFLLQFLLTFPTNRVDSNAHNYAQGIANGNDAVYKVERARYLDSMSSEVLFSIPLLKTYTYQDLKKATVGFGS